MTTRNYPPDDEKKLSAKQLAAVPLLARGDTIDATARTIGVAEKTIDLWKKQPAFMAAVRQAERDIFDESMQLLRRTAKAAIITLIRNMDPKQAAPYVQVASASKLLDAAIEQLQLSEIKQLLTEFEERTRQP